MGTFGSAAAAGCALSLNAQQMRWLLDYAAQQAGAGFATWRRDTDHIEKGFVFGGSSARNGVNAALMVQLGWTAVTDVMSGPDNFVLSYNPKADPGKMVDGLGERYEVTMTTLKRWTTGGPIQSPLDALQLILKKHPFEPDQVKQVVVRAATSAAYTVNNREMPDICLQHMVAVMILDKTASFKAAHDKPRMQDPEVLRVRAKVQLIADDELEKLIPKRVAIVEVTLNDGTKLTERVESVRGTPENPMNREEVVAKARDLIVPVLGATKCDALVEKLLNLENVKDIRELRPLLATDLIGRPVSGFRPRVSCPRGREGGVLAQTDGGNMRIVLNIVGVLLVLLGSIWVLQGINVLPGSFMSGQMRWAVRGGILVFAGIVGLVWANRKRKSAA